MKESVKVQTLTTDLSNLRKQLRNLDKYVQRQSDLRSGNPTHPVHGLQLALDNRALLSAKIKAVQKSLRELRRSV
jgi:hypothetical protein